MFNSSKNLPETISKQPTHLDWTEVLLQLENLSTSNRVKESIHKLLPLNSAAEAESEFLEVSEVLKVLMLGQRPFMESLDRFQFWYSRLCKQAVLQPLEIKDVGQFCAETLSLQTVFSQSSGCSHLQTDCKSLKLAPDILLQMIQSLINELGEIREDASPRLAQLFSEKNSLTKQMHRNLERLVKAHEMESVIQEKFVTTREGRWVIPVRSGMRHALTDGIVHSLSQSKQTVFMEPAEVVPLNNKIRQIEIDIEEEIEEILKKFSQNLYRFTGPLKEAEQLLLRADLLFAKAKLALLLNAQPIVFAKDRIKLMNVKHPLLILKGNEVIGNDVRLDFKHRILLLSGPNAGGKTVLLKSIGLAAQMSRHGLFSCVDSGSEIPFFCEIKSVIGDQQSVDSDLSTFAAHLLSLNQAAKLAGPLNLVLVDEICGSTDPEEGTALAQSFIEEFAGQNSFAVITSHFGGLKNTWAAEGPVLNGSLEYDKASGRPTYRFIPGVPGQSFAFQTADRVGTPAKILDRAKDHLSPIARARIDQLNQIDQLKTDYVHALQNAEVEQKKFAEKRQKYEKLLENFRQERDVWFKRFSQKTEKKIDDLINQASVTEIFKKHERVEELEKIRESLPEIVKALPSKPSGQQINSVEDFQRLYPPGSKVFAASIQSDAIIQGRANSRGEIPILSGSMRLFLHWSTLKPTRSIQGAENPTQKTVRQSALGSALIIDSERSIDLRGMNADIAITTLDRQLDSAILQGESRVKIIHGYGTETLKKAVRSYLGRSLYVSSWIAGTPQTGGDGITWADLSGR